MPPWLQQVIEISRTKRGSIKIKLTSIQVFLNIIGAEFAGENEIPLAMTKLQALCLPKPARLGGEIDASPLPGDQNFCRDIIKTLWALLSESSDADFQIVQLLKRFDILVPKIFSNVVTQELNSKDREVKHRAVKKFAIFWKITAKDYKEYKPFQPEHERYRENQLRSSSGALFSGL